MVNFYHKELLDSVPYILVVYNWFFSELAVFFTAAVLPEFPFLLWI
jgi:hypothetical protein